MPFKVFYEEFPAHLHGAVRGMILLRKGFAAIFIDSWLPKDQQERSLRHELAHLALGHLTAAPPADADPDASYIKSDTLEAEADRLAAEMSQEEYEYLMLWAI